MHAYCITGGTTVDRSKKEQLLCETWGIRSFDIFRINAELKQSIGIDDIRQLNHSLSLSPLKSASLVGIIDEAHRMTPEAQHALLKTLEEPQKDARIILKTFHISLLLSTVISRCQVIQLPGTSPIADEERKKTLQIIHSFQGKSYGEICSLNDKLFDTKEEKGQFLNAFLYVLHEDLVLSPKNNKKQTRPLWEKSKIPHMIRAVITAQNQLAANVNPLLLFDAFFFTISLYKPQTVVYN